MDIDLSKVIGYSRDSLQSRALMRSIMLDLYPGKTREMNVLLDVYESGVPRKIKNDGNITDAKYAQYVQKIVDDYGMQEQWAVVGLNAWIDVCLGKGTAVTIKYRVVTVPSNGGNASNGNIVGGGYTNPIVHNANGNSSPVVVKGRAEDYEIRDLGNGTAEIKKYNGFDQEDTLIPTEIGGKRIVGIGEDAFKSCVGIKRLIIPEGITSIAKGAFSGCSNLYSVVLPTTLRILGEAADGYGTGVFQGTNIENINLPNDIKEIGPNTFYNCKQLLKVQLPDNLSAIGKYAFQNCSKIVDIVLPVKVRSIKGNAFEGCSSLKTVQLNEGLTEIGEEAFKECNQLLSITIPSTVNKFGSGIFTRGFRSGGITVRCYPGSKAIEYCRNNRIKIDPIGGVTANASFDSVNIVPITHAPISNPVPQKNQNINQNDYEIRDLGNGAAEIKKYNGFDQEDTLIPTEIGGKRIVGIGEDAFKSCVGIKRLIIPEGVTSIAKGAFSGCSNLYSVVLPTTLKTLGEAADGYGTGAFQGTNIESINLPNSLRKIGPNTFYNCKQLVNVELPDNLFAIGKYAFQNCSKIVRIVLPTTVRSIKGNVFEGCSALKDVQLNEGLLEIGEEAFKECNQLLKITIPSTVNRFGSGIFTRGFRSSGITVRCYPGSKAIEYCRNNRINIENAGA